MIALTLSPMNCAWLLRKTERDATNWEARLVRTIDHVLEWLSGAYRRRLEAVFAMKPVVVVFALLLLAGIPGSTRPRPASSRPTRTRVSCSR